jgi:uncharacterized protein YdeI (YjbR/CyaY-like superfamily)
MITDVNTYFTLGCGRCDRFASDTCTTKIWADGLADLRALCLAAGLEETAKWGHPCYMFAGRNLAIIGAFKGDFRLTFFHAALMTDPMGILEKQGANSQNPDMIRFTATDAVAQKSPLVTAYLLEAMGYARAGLLPPKTPRDIDTPPELIEALDADPDLAEAFHGLTQGRQKSWMFHLNSTKTPATRYARIEKGRAKIMAGKGALDR